MKLLTAIVALVMLSAPSQAAKGKAKAGGKADNTSATKAEVVSAKAFLEDLMAKRYGQELETLLNSEDFKIGAKLDLVFTPPVAPPPPKPFPEYEDSRPLPTDLLLGTIDPDALLKKYADPDTRQQVGTYLSSFRISAVTVTVGLNEKLGPDAKKTVETWLADRVKNEFGAIGKTSVTFIQHQKEEFIDKLHRFQDLAGHLAVALAILVGVILAMMLTRGASSNATGAKAVAAEGAGAGDGAAAAGAAQGDAAAGAAAEAKANGGGKGAAGGAKADDSEEQKILNDIRGYNEKLQSLGGALAAETASVIRTWVEEGDAGKVKLACFAEAAGTALGKLPIPVDAYKDLQQVFVKMPEMPAKEKRDVLQKIYWDLMSAINLGADILVKPFGYLGTMDVGMVNQGLMEQNMRMKALVSLHMPEKLRQSYLKSLKSEDKIELLNEAAEISEIPADEYRALDGEFKAKLSGGSRTDSVAFQGAFAKIASALSPLEELTLLKGLEGAGLEQYKRTVPSLSFFEQWTDDRLGVLLSGVMPDELTAYLRVRPENKDRFVGLCPPMTAELTNDEINRPDMTTPEDKDRLLGSFLDRLRALVERGDINLNAIFKEAPTGDPGDSEGQRAA